MLEEPREEGKACWLNDTALGNGFLKPLLAASMLGIDIKKSENISFLKSSGICQWTGVGF